MTDKPHLNPALPIEVRVEALLDQMTLDEKIGQMNQARNDAHCLNLMRQGKVGSVLCADSAWAGSTGQTHVNAEMLNQAQRVALEESRLGIPVIFARDVIHGYRTIAPIPLAQAASWSPELVRKIAAMAAREAAADGLRWALAPVLDIARDGRWGRVAEGFGEDPYLCSAMAHAAVRGFQGDDYAAEEHMVACAKHFVGYGACEGGRDYNTAEITLNTLRNVYLPSFKAAVDAGVGTLMAAFNDIGGIPLSANRHLLTEVLRSEWGFDGFVLSDWAAIDELRVHGIAANRADCARLAVNAGVDMDMAISVYLHQLAELVHSGAVSQTVIDEAVRRILRIKFRLGLFEHPYTDTFRAAEVQVSADHRRLAREAARHCAVLLKNQGDILPLRDSGVTVGVFGPLAKARAPLFGTWTLDGRAEDVRFSLLEAIRARMKTDAVVAEADLTDDAVSLARICDVVVAVIGEAPQRSGEDNCLTTLDLPPGQPAFLEALHGLGVPLVVVVLAGRPLSISWLAQHADAILLAWHPGIEGAWGITDLLFGDALPTGKLPITFPRAVGQVPIYYNHKPTGRPVSHNKYRYNDLPDIPLYPFGYGLSYTTYAYRNLTIEVRPGFPVLVRVEVTNTGARTGEEIVQLYIRDCVASVSRPVKELKGFERVRLQAGETKQVEFVLWEKDLSFYDADEKLIFEPGDFSVWVGPNSAEGLEGAFTV